MKESNLIKRACIVIKTIHALFVAIRMAATLFQLVVDTVLWVASFPHLFIILIRLAPGSFCKLAQVTARENRRIALISLWILRPDRFLDCTAPDKKRRGSFWPPYENFHSFFVSLYSFRTIYETETFQRTLSYLPEFFTATLPQHDSFHKLKTK